MTKTQGTTVSIMQGYVRIGTASTWDQAREVLRGQIKAVFWALPQGIRTSEARDAELAKASGPVDGGGYLWVSPTAAWMDSVRYAVQGDVPRGIGQGDLAIVQDYPNGHYGWWTIAVKCKVVAVGQTFATVRITGESCQFRRHSVISVPLSALRPRGQR